MAWAIMSRLDRGFSCTTIDLNIQYPAPAAAVSSVVIAGREMGAIPGLSLHIKT